MRFAAQADGTTAGLQRLRHRRDLPCFSVQQGAGGVACIVVISVQPDIPAAVIAQHPFRLRPRVPDGFGAACGVHRCQDRAAEAASRYDLALLKVRLAVVHTDKAAVLPIVGIAVGTLGQVGARTRAGVKAVNLHRGVLDGGGILLRIGGQRRIGHIAAGQQCAVKARKVMLGGLQHKGLRLPGGKVDAAGGRWPDSYGRRLRSVRYCHPLTVERAAIADIHVVVTVGQRQVGAGLARSGVNSVKAGRRALLGPDAAVLGFKFRIGHGVKGLRSSDAACQFFRPVVVPALVVIEICDMPDIHGVPRCNHPIMAGPPRKICRAGGGIVGAAGDGAADGLNRRGIVGLEQQRVAEPLRELVVGGAVIKGAVVAFQGVEIGGRGRRRGCGRCGGSGRCRRLRRGGGEGCRVGGSGAGRESQSYCSGQDDGDIVFHVGLLLLIFQLNGKGKWAKPLRPHRLGHLPTAWGGFCAGGGVFGDTAALYIFCRLRL